MALECFRILINELLNKGTEIFPEEVPLVILDSKSDVSLSNNVKYTNHTRYIARRLNFERNGKN